MFLKTMLSVFIKWRNGGGKYILAEKLETLVAKLVRTYRLYMLTSHEICNMIVFVCASSSFFARCAYVHLLRSIVKSAPHDDAQTVRQRARR